MLNFVSSNIYNYNKLDDFLTKFKNISLLNIFKADEKKSKMNIKKKTNILKHVFIAQSPINVSKYQMLYFKIYLEYTNKTYKFTRILYNLPIRKIKTHNVSRKKKWIWTTSIKYCLKQIDLFKNLKLPKSKIQILFFCEYINSLWFFNWYDEWLSANKKRIKFVKKNPHIKWNYDYVGLINGNIIQFVTKKKKSKHNRRKQIISKNSYNVGFYYGFSIFYVKKITFNLQKKSTKHLKKK